MTERANYKFAFLLLAAFVLESRGEVTVYSSESDFLEAIDVVATLDFDAYSVGEITDEQFLESHQVRESVLLEDVAFSSNCFRPDSACWQIESAPGGNFLSSQLSDENLLTVTFETSRNLRPAGAPHVQGVGFRIVSDHAFDSGGTLKFYVHEKNGPLFEETPNAELVVPVGDDESWIGFSAPPGIWRVVIEDTSSGRILFGLDDIAHSEIVPEPSGVLMMLLAMVLGSRLSLRERAA